MPLAPPSRLKAFFAFAILFVLYQSAEGLGGRVLDNFGIQAALMVAALVAGWPVARWLGWRGYEAYGLDLRLASFAVLAAGLMLTLAAKGAALAAGLSLGIASVGATPETLGALAGAGFLATAALTTFVPSITEDILTRGFLLRAIGVRWSGPAFVLASAALFTVNHIYRFDWGVSEQVRLFCCGLAYAAAAWRWRTLWGAVGLHWGYNLANAVWERLSPVSIDAVVAGRWLTAAVHLVLLAIIVALPRRTADGKPDQMPAYHS
ncbi:MAG: CPBP family intramembrane metalloprotease [Brevundimonas sp.]|nr:CPBP family intramembrane metalloprotease [Brevundimonas sp.]